MVPEVILRATLPHVLLVQFASHNPIMLHYTPIKLTLCQTNGFILWLVCHFAFNHWWLMYPLDPMLWSTVFPRMLLHLGATIQKVEEN